MAGYTQPLRRTLCYAPDSLHLHLQMFGDIIYTLLPQVGSRQFMSYLTRARGALTGSAFVTNVFDLNTCEIKRSDIG